MARKVKHVKHHVRKARGTVHHKHTGGKKSGGLGFSLLPK